MESFSKVSIIIPVYNSELFLKDTLESVLKQTYSNIEIIVINDGSTDRSLEILQQYTSKIILINQQNMGLAHAVNMGIKQMSGQWMKWMSPDDLLAPNAIEVLINKAKKLPKDTILYSNWEIIDKNGKKIRNFNESNYNSISNFDFNVRLLDRQQINVNTVLIPISIFQKGCIMRDLDDVTSIDYDFFLRASILYGARFHLVEENLLKYRVHKKQTSHTNIVKSLKLLDRVKKEVLFMLDDKTRSSYLHALVKYRKNKEIGKKVMDIGLKMILKLPKLLSNAILVFYLNKIRHER